MLQCRSGFSAIKVKASSDRKSMQLLGFLHVKMSCASVPRLIWKRLFPARWKDRRMGV